MSDGQALWASVDRTSNVVWTSVGTASQRRHHRQQAVYQRCHCKKARKFLNWLITVVVIFILCFLFDTIGRGHSAISQFVIRDLTSTRPVNTNLQTRIWFEYCESRCSWLWILKLLYLFCADPGVGSTWLDCGNGCSEVYSVEFCLLCTWRPGTCRTAAFLSASLYVSKRGAYWDRLCRDVVGR